MSERFTKLYELQRNLYSEGSPVIVSAGDLLKDTQTNNIIVQLKFHSVSSKIIKALKVSIAAFDIAGKEIEGVSEYQYLDLSIQNSQKFGSNKAIVMPDSVTRSFAIKSITVVLADGQVQNASMPLSPLPQPTVIQSVLEDDELIKQYKLKTNDCATYIPQESVELWQCYCGEWNSTPVCSQCKAEKSTAFSALDLPTLTNEMNNRLAVEAQRRFEAEQKQAEQARIQAEKKAKRNAAVKKGAKRTLIVVGIIAAICIALVMAGIIFLFATDKPIDDDFSQNYEDSLHNLTYYVPENWEYSTDESSDNESWYTRYDNWGNFLGAMVVSYEGESPEITVDSVVAEFQSECSEAKSATENIAGQDFAVITFELDSADETPFFYNIYVAEENSSVFYISFIFVEDSNKVNVFNEIVGAIAFDDYVNPNEIAYNEAVSLMSAERYSDAYDILSTLGNFKNSNILLEECLAVVFDENIAKLIAAENYVEAYGLLVSSGKQEQLKHFKAVYTSSSYSDKYYESNSVYTYDELGNLLKDVKTYEDGDKKIKDYTYDSNNRLITERITESDSPSDYFETTYEYNAVGQKIKEVTTYDYGNGKAGSYTYKYEYDPNGNMVSSIYSKAGESGEKVTKYEYNSNGQITKELYHDGTYYYFEYGTNNELLKKAYVYSDGHESYDSYQYDDNGVLSKETDCYGNSIEYIYDSNYCLIKMIEYDEEQIDSVTEYGEYIVFYLFAD